MSGIGIKKKFYDGWNLLHDTVLNVKIILGNHLTYKNKTDKEDYEQNLFMFYISDALKHVITHNTSYYASY